MNGSQDPGHEAVGRVVAPHGLVPLTGRDPREEGRAGSALELIFDLVAVVAVSIAASNLEGLLAEGHVLAGVFTFGFAVFGITWAWNSYSQLLSAFDTDDWLVRLVTLVQMAGILILALGLAPMVASIDAGQALNNQVMVGGYVLMRLGTIVLWARVARDSPAHRVTALRYIKALIVSQIGWCLQAFLPLPAPVGLTIMAIWLIQEVTYPLWAERTGAIPRHPEHMGERLSAFVIITLGEVVLGTFTAVQADLSEHAAAAAQAGTPGASGLGAGGLFDAVGIGAAGLGLAFGIWWIYFIVPTGEIFGARGGMQYSVSLLHIVLYAAIAAVGSGLHLAATFVEGEGGLSLIGVASAVAVPVFLAVLMVFVCFTVMVPGLDWFHAGLVAGTAALGVLGCWLAAAGASLGVVLLVLMLMPWVSVVGYELHGHRQMAPRVARTLSALRLR